MSHDAAAASIAPVPAPPPATLCDAFARTVERYSDRPALRTVGEDATLTWRDYADQVRRVAAGLAAQGIGHGDTVALMLTNRPEAFVVDVAALHLGAIPYSIYNTSSQEQIGYVLDHAASRVIVTERQFVDRIRASAEQLAHTPRIFIVDAASGAGAPALGELVDAGDPDFDLNAAARAIGPEAVAALIYTSGTTGPPKGVELTHDNLCAWWAAAREVLGLRDAGRVMSYLPMAHLGDRVMAHYPAIFSGATITCVPDPRDAVRALSEVRPTFWLGVPRIWEKLMAALCTQSLDGVDVPARLGLDQADAVLSGSAPIPPEVLEFFSRVGITICECWGLSETTSIATVNPPEDIRVGTVGRAVPGVEVKLADDGELLVRGAVVMRGYRNDSRGTTEAIGPDGFLRTGDVGEIDADGYVRIVDRKKELIVNAAGKNMSPANIERKVKAACPLIGSVVAVGDRRPYTVALVILDPEAAAGFAAERGLSDGSVGALAASDEMRAHVRAAVEQANARLSRVEQIKRFVILPVEWPPGGDELTPTMKLKRRPIAEKYATEIDRLYADIPAPPAVATDEARP